VTTADLLYLALIAIGLVVDHFVLWPAFLRRSQTGPSHARLWLWSSWMILLWTLVATGVALWLFEARTWEALRFVIPHGWRLWSTLGLVLALAITNARTVVRITRSSRSRRVKMGNPHAEKLSPHTRSELGWWVALSLSAGFCEEFIFRGYLIWALQPMLGLWGAAAFSVVAFAMAHTYQGVKGILGTGIVGSLLTLVVLISGSLLPAIALHALIDIGQGLVAWLVFRRTQDEGDMVAAEQQRNMQDSPGRGQ
jgi:membrane protease YdiL (CAAX protease family)